MLSLAAAVVAALANATASVLQRVAAREQPEKTAFSLRLLWDLAHRPVWLMGISAVAGGFLMQAVALATGSLAAVQPVLVLELPFTILLATVVFRGRLGCREWLAVAAMSGGLALFLVSLRPSGGNPSATSPLEWSTGIAAGVCVTAVLVWLGRRSRYAKRAALLSVATGLLFGVTAALIAGMTAPFTHGITGGVHRISDIPGAPVRPDVRVPTAKHTPIRSPGGGTARPYPDRSCLCGAVGRGFVRGSDTRWAWLIPATIGASLVAVGTINLARSPILQGARRATEETGKG